MESSWGLLVEGTSGGLGPGRGASSEKEPQFLKPCFEKELRLLA